MRETLENEFIKVEIEHFGAELKSVYNKIDNTELLWQGDLLWWGKTSPILFPRIGYEENELTKQYSVPKHGFARDNTFIVLRRTPDELVFLLSETDIKSISFKLPFKLYVTYSLSKSTLNISYEVDAYFDFMIGGHPAFNLSKEDNSLHFNNDEFFKLKAQKIDFNTIHHKAKPNLDITDETFIDDALVFKNESKENSVKLNDSLILKHYSQYLGLWSPPCAPFVCIEPWNVSSHNSKNLSYSIMVIC